MNLKNESKQNKNKILKRFDSRLNGLYYDKSFHPVQSLFMVLDFAWQKKLMHTRIQRSSPFSMVGTIKKAKINDAAKPYFFKQNSICIKKVKNADKYVIN